ncbi:hypothetical protein PJM47_03970 [Mycobacterium kansasii]|uniref:hypothetical protein n=1 Tax=Mycobacterium kansasii TaxID=1768 RepID=UPI00190FC5B1|nr:hypothetical protein [Mycobacterium kansasii]GFP51832.1 hypothetical protein MKANGN_57100 [Mycobacterium kansasii]
MNAMMIRCPDTVGKLDLEDSIQQRTSITSHQLAWHLADVLRQATPKPIRTKVYMLLGCQQYVEAILELLRIATRRNLRINPALLEGISGWLGGYVQHRDYDQISHQLGRLEFAHLVVDAGW